MQLTREESYKAFTKYSSEQSVDITKVSPEYIYNAGWDAYERSDGGFNNGALSVIGVILVIVGFAALMLSL